MKKLRFVLSICIPLWGSLYSYAQVNERLKFEQLKSLQERDRNLVMVFIQTDWCKYCKAMKQAIIKNKQVSSILDKNFYTVFLNAEEKRDIVFADHLFKYKPTGSNTGIHQLAEQLGSINGKISYPVLCFLNEKNEIVYQSEGYLNPKAFAEVLNLVSKSKL